MKIIQIELYTQNINLPNVELKDYNLIVNGRKFFDHLPNVEIKDYNPIANERNFFDQPVKK